MKRTTTPLQYAKRYVKKYAKRFKLFCRQIMNEPIVRLLLYVSVFMIVASALLFLVTLNRNALVIGAVGVLLATFTLHGRAKDRQFRYQIRKIFRSDN